ncbi:hypothetical protein ACFOG5_18130 [Pedobacter fastidiosus]|uniref:Lipocalin-like domain-containing protein n=1 Tax=Pedobacter fastidiosus TaxID=2765361 RepID=A0ABR7KSG7_9SPHI|nr:hypothetical protein [Pedobacter fastidiosus]MBC6111002.1 hypothetical protein [Pedobacter fastidiosus]
MLRFKKSLSWIGYCICFFGAFFLTQKYGIIIYYICKETKDVTKVRNTLKGTWVIVKKENFRFNNEELGHQIKFGKYVRYFESSYFPESINVVHENGSYSSHSRKGYYIRDPNFTEANMTYNMKILTLNQDTLKLGIETSLKYPQNLLIIIYKRKN